MPESYRGPKRGRSFPSRLPKRKPSGSTKRGRFPTEISKKKCGVKDYGDFIAHGVDKKRARDLEERAKRRRAGQARPGAHVCARDEEVEAPDRGPNGGPPSG